MERFRSFGNGSSSGQAPRQGPADSEHSGLAQDIRAIRVEWILVWALPASVRAR